MDVRNRHTSRLLRCSRLPLDTGALRLPEGGRDPGTLFVVIALFIEETLLPRFSVKLWTNDLRIYEKHRHRTEPVLRAVIDHPFETVTDAGTVATDWLLVDKFTTAPAEPALASICTVQVAVVPDVGARGPVRLLTLKPACANWLEPIIEAMMVAEPCPTIVTGNDAAEPRKGTVAVGGTVATLVSLLDKLTVTP